MCVHHSTSERPELTGRSVRTQAYDGHMNLILSDVEETIMVVDVPDGVPETEGTVRVSGGCGGGVFSLWRDRLTCMMM